MNQRLVRVGLVQFLMVASCHAGLTVSESFRDSTAPGWIFSQSGTDPGPFLTAGASSKLDPVGDGWLRLTSLSTNQSNSAFYDKAISLGVGQGLSVEFDFAIYNGTGADGLTFSLLDGSVATPKAGGYGGSLGYANRSYINGVTGGYLGIGLDELGNFSNPTEGRNGGPGSTPNAIVVRGAGRLQSGYAYLTGTKNLGNNFLYNRKSTGRPSQTGADYRRFSMTLFEKSPSELLLTVAIQSGFGKAPVEVIKNFNVIGTFSGFAQPGLPGSIKFGFTSGTGALMNIHEIRNFQLGTYDSSALTITAVPEPTTLGSASLATLVAGTVRRRSRRGR